MEILKMIDLLEDKVEQTKTIPLLNRALIDREDLLAAIEDLKVKVGIKKTIKDYDVDEKYFLDTLDDMVEKAFDDQCTGANPRYPLMSEIKEIYLKAYYGK